MDQGCARWSAVLCTCGTARLCGRPVTNDPSRTGMARRRSAGIWRLGFARPAAVGVGARAASCHRIRPGARTYIIGEGCVERETQISLPMFKSRSTADAAALASELGCDSHPRGSQVSSSTETWREEGVPSWPGGPVSGASWHPPSASRLPFSSQTVRKEVWATVVSASGAGERRRGSREQTGGYAAVSHQRPRSCSAAPCSGDAGGGRQLGPGLRCEVQAASLVVRPRGEGQGKCPCWELVSGIDNIHPSRRTLTMWGPRDR